MKGIEKAQLGIITVLAAMLVSITRRLPVTRGLSSGVTTLTLAGIVLLVAAGGASAAPCPAPGDMVITTSCELNRSWTVLPGQAGYIIGADGVTIDGNGYTITGTTTAANCEWASETTPCTVSGIYNEGYDDVVIKNLWIEGFCTGVALAGSGANKIRNNIVDNCKIHDNGFNIPSGGSSMTTHGVHACWIETGAGGEPAVTITESDICNNEGTGSACGAGGNGIFIYAGGPGDKHEKCDISYNNLYGNAKSGFWTKMMLTQSNITHNEIGGNGYGTGIGDDQRGGIVLRCKMSNENLIAHNHVYDNDVDGIYVGGSNNTIEYNTVTNNSDDGIDMGRSDGSYDNELCENTVCDNGDYDISVYGTGSNTIGDENTCDTTWYYDDTGTTGCTYPCAAEQPYYCDSDDDGYISADSSGTGTELPPGCSWDVGDDCDDTNPDVNPGAAENCTDGIDNDCDGLIDGDDPDCAPNKVFFVPDDIRVPRYCNTTTVGIWIDTVAVITSGQMEFYYADCCMNVTDYEINSTYWIPPSDVVLTPGKVKIILNAAGSGVGPGLLHIGDITVHCCNETSYCFTDLDWDENPLTSYLFTGPPAAKIDVGWMDGVFRCNIPDLEITMVKGNEINETHYNVSYTIENTGDVHANGSYTSLKVDDDPNPIETMRVSLAPHDIQTHTFISKINQTGTVDTLMVCADWNDTVVELDEDNNCMKGRYPGEVVIRVMPADTFVQPQDQFDVKIYVDTKGMEVYAVQYRLTYDTSVVRAETQTKGPLLGPIGDTMVVVNNVDQPHGEVSYAETRTESGGVTESDNVTNIHFIAIGPRSATTNLTLDDIIISDKDGIRIGCRIEDGTVEITENTAPVPISVTKHRINNVAQKYQSTAILCSCSYDPDYPGKGGNITYIRWAFGDGQYGTSEGLPDENNCTCKEHRYESWQWDPLGVPYNPENPEAGGNYVPFDVRLDVMDDGYPELTNNTNITIDVFIAGDANGDGEVNILDAVWVGKNWRAECEPCNPYPDDYPETLPDYCGCDDCEGNYWNDAQAEDGADGADLNNDCEINILDAVIIGANWRHVAW